MVTNGIKHSLKVGQVVWSIRCTGSQEYVIEGFTAKRVVCREIDGSGKGRKLSTSNHCPSSLFAVESVKKQIDSPIL